MTLTTENPETARPPVGATRGWLPAMLRRLHFYAGVLVGPFILVAAATGALYAFSPQLERALYADLLEAPSSETALPLADQVEAAVQSVGGDVVPTVVRPAPEPGDTTRVMFTLDEEAQIHGSELLGVFVDPGTAEVLGQDQVYGTSGSLPLRTDIAQAHRHMFLGDWGRLYSELAASWLGVVVLAGVGLWALRWRRLRASRRSARGLLVPQGGERGYRRTRSWHAALGIWIAAGGLFLAATGITWSTYGGSNVTDLRQALSWETPSVQTDLGDAAHAEDEHAGHEHHGGDHGASDEADVDPAAIDEVLQAGRDAGFTSTRLEIILPREADQAWTIQDVSMRAPAPEVFSVAVDPDAASATDVLRFEDYPFVAQLAQWGIWLHMGTLFGLANQALLFGLSTGLALMVIWGYVMWWQRRPRHGGRAMGPAPAPGALRRAPWWGVLLTVGSAALVAWFLPVLGVSLVAFVIGDVLWQAHLRRRFRQEVDRWEPSVRE
ncbi:PepSY domain-containing protein [Nesterenkonia sp. HG001]|uniref:PepSY-associated TM helix domain-containing protein n=1 Tax=Nesterenkonia sp. HG001 TaxID=2983207 RepID=UPI002AC505BA|nr:PepSY domain-containing protein [Nesterenkonia sp. HG001]MDZ5079053.1 PepSY domain-containing protein [Nesterenkonia sp. HG001]